MPWWPRFSGGGDGAAGSGSDSNGGATKWRFAESGARGGRQLPPIPPELPLLPLQNAVLLPLGFLRVRVLASPLSDEASLARHLHRVLHQGFADPASDATAAAAVTVDRRPRPIIAAVPVVNTLVAVQISGDGAIVQPPTGSWTSGLSTASQKIEDVRNGEASEDEIAEPSGQNSTHHLFPLGSAAVVLQAKKVKIKGESAWELLLEGLCRISVEHVEQDQRLNFYSVRVRDLERSLLADSASLGKFVGNRDLGAALSNGDEKLVEQLKEVSGRLIQGLRAALVESETKGQAGRHGSTSILTATDRLSTMLSSLPPPRAADLLASALADTSDRLAILSAVDINKRLTLTIALANGVLRALSNPDTRIGLIGVQEGQGRKGDAEMAGQQQQRDNSETAALLARMKKADPPAEILEAGLKEVEKLERMGEQHPAAATARAYVELIGDLPWRQTASTLAGAGHRLKSLEEIRIALDQGHKGLGKVKQRILEYVAVGRLISSAGAAPPGPILCFIGPPGVGKTSLADSIASVLGRPLSRIALGGVRDEAEIRGHRRTYVGAMPGRILQGIRRAKCRDPVMLLDEVDKMGFDHRGDPTAALLEVLDPAQNHAFVDTFLGLPFDLSHVVFVATANEEGAIPVPLRDRMEIIRLSGYTLEERISIAEAHLLPRVLKSHGLPPDGMPFAPGTLELLIQGWTREAGVRGLERCLAAIARHVALETAVQLETRRDMASVSCAAVEALDSSSTAQGHSADRGCSTSLGESESSSGSSYAAPSPSVIVDEALLTDILGPQRYRGHEAEEQVTAPGAAAGLVWTPVGGSLQFVEACIVSSGCEGREGRLTLTGQLGDVLEESARIALSWCRSNAVRLGLVGQRAGSSPLGVSVHANGKKNSRAVLAPDHDQLQRRALAAAPRQAGDEIAAVAGGGEPLAVFAADIHVHFPAGAIPKDGPSAGVTLACALVSLFSGRPVRGDVAMTGELSLRGVVLPVGGIKEKILAARQAGMSSVLLPARNMPDVETDIPAKLREELSIVPCSSMEDVLAAAFQGGYQLLPPAWKSKL